MESKAIYTLPVYSTLIHKPDEWADGDTKGRKFWLVSSSMSARGERIEGHNMADTLADDTFKYKLVNENVLISIAISLNVVPKGPINNNPALVQITAWRQPYTKCIVYRCIYA